MDTSTRNILVTAAVVAVALGGFLLIREKFSPAANETAARATVTAFGEQLQKVSLLSPDASSTMATSYGKYVTPELLAGWRAHPQSAPGRRTSSPWPDHIQITNAAPQGAGYVVSGGVVLMTSDGLAGVIPVVMQVVRQNGTWLIAAYQEQATSSAAIE